LLCQNASGTQLFAHFGPNSKDIFGRRVSVPLIFERRVAVNERFGIDRALPQVGLEDRTKTAELSKTSSMRSPKYFAGAAPDESKRSGYSYNLRQRFAQRAKFRNSRVYWDEHKIAATKHLEAG